MELDERQTCLGCKKRVNLLVDGYRCLDCPFFFCRPCAEYHFGKTDVSPVTGEKDPPAAAPLPPEVEKLIAKAEDLLVQVHTQRNIWPAEIDDLEVALAPFRAKDDRGKNG